MKYIDEGYVKAVMINDRLRQGNAELTLYMQQVERQVSAMPSIEIIRCKDCKHWCKGDEVYGICYRCPNTRQMRLDDFCSYGSRSEKPNNLERRSE